MFLGASGAKPSSSHTAAGDVSSRTAREIMSEVEDVIDEPLVPGPLGRLQKVERAGDVDLDEPSRREANDVRLVQGTGVYYRLDAVLLEHSID